MDLVAQLSRELASCALNYVTTSDAMGAVVDEEELAHELSDRAREWIDRRPALRVLLRVVVR